jgi:hypothetical protein
MAHNRVIMYMLVSFIIMCMGCMAIAGIASMTMESSWQYMYWHGFGMLNYCVPTINSSCMDEIPLFSL